jgi:carbamoyl-phosphate synthase large subunit
MALRLHKEKLMIIGAGKFQVPIIEQAKQMGFETIVVSIAGKYPGFLLADKSYHVDVREKDIILEIARKEGIAGVVTDQTDWPVPTVAYVAERMGLPGIGYECALQITNKLKCREHCRKMGFPIPKFQEATCLEEAREQAKDLRFPLIVKPVDSTAARGVAKVNHFSELARKFQNAFECSAAGLVLLEEFFPGKKLELMGFTSNQEFTNLLMAENEHFDVPDLFIIRQVLAPPLLDQDLKDRIFAFHTRLFQSFGALFGITFSDIKVNEENGEFCLIEAALRGPGGFLSSHVSPLASGIDVVPALIEFATGRRKEFQIDKSKVLNRGAGNIYFYLPEGTVSRIKGIDEIKSMPGIHKVALDDLFPGRKIEPLRNLSGRQGPIVYAGEDRGACEEIIEKVKAVLRVEVQTPEGIRGMVWS